MKVQADKGRSERQFEVGSLVYLKLQPYIQTSVAPWSNQKLAFRFYGPFKILKRIGKVAYHLDLPESCKIHPVVHVSQLKMHVPPNEQVSSDISTVPLDSSQELLPVAVLDHRLVSIGSSTQSQVQVQWSSSHPDFTTWEEIHDIMCRFPDAPVWGQPGSQGGGDVTVLQHLYRIAKE